ncbi:unnamed protein product (macronuclear) [Paramecium tetraurelia]|uniref:Uncharacterized protein n=1 Tax=Paramecium tetraurelia TaxID=5888 RepID=A0BQN2_PARTE|nr:uncharacterized protein GSPATT00031078001 [Paramecium tetraurelia]CAK60849.1 unnamed protein product [Paramecium tetraurelia]|eukprot:XP_001428247.1 hypothetical protein (macronuclear) [Paramecium tetraurelia strain d4-2]
MIIKLVVLILCVIASDNWNQQHQYFNTTTLTDSEGWWVQGNKGQNISTCGNVQLFGGFNAFGTGAAVSNLIPLDPHFKIRVTFQFWKIDSWDNEIVYYILGDNVQQRSWFWSSGNSICGNTDYQSEWKEVIVEEKFEFLHQEPTLAVIIKTTLDESPNNESWGFRNFIVEVVLCSPGCLSCSNDTPDECLYYVPIEVNWFDSFNFDGWLLDNQQFVGISQCANMTVIGGVGLISGNKQLAKKYTSLIPHYKLKLQVQFWKFDFWNNNKFTLEIDGQKCQEAVFNQFEVIPLCGDSNGAEKLLDIRQELTHTSDSLQICMYSDLIAANAFWGLRGFRLFLAKCDATCLTCSGPNKNDCQSCQPGYRHENNECLDVKWILGLSQYFQPQDFQIQPGWTISNIYYNQSPFQICANTNLVGGYSLLSKDSEIALTMDLPKHIKVRVKVQFWKFDTWDNEWLQVYANGNRVYQEQFGLTGVQVICGSTISNAYAKYLDFEFIHKNPSINLVMTTTLNENAVNESWGIRNFQLFYGIIQECSYSIIEAFSLPSFIGTKNIQTSFYSFDQSLQNKLIITELGISLYPEFDETITVDSSIKKLTISIIWKCFQTDLNLSITILQSSYPDYQTRTVICKTKQSNVLNSQVVLERTIKQESQLRLVATSTSIKVNQIIQTQTIKQYEIAIN